MSRKAISRRSKAGLPPGTLIPVGEQRVDHTTLSLIEYSADIFTERTLPDMAAYRALPPSNGVRWLNVTGLHDADLMREIGEVFGIHALVLEDIMTIGQRPRMEDYGDTLYIVLKMLYRGRDEGLIASEQISLILGSFGLLSFQEVAGDVFEPIRERIRREKGQVRNLGADYLAYRMLDAIIDNYFIILEEVTDRIELIQDKVSENPEKGVIQDIHVLKRDIIVLRKALWPVREVVAGIQRSESDLVDESTGLFLRDAYEHAIQVVDAVETMRDTLSSALDIYLSSISNRMNEIMRVLTVIATLFIPLTFIVGVYGMNFQHMPELAWRYGYGGVWLVMIVTVIVMLALFRRNKWF